MAVLRILATIIGLALTELEYCSRSHIEEMPYRWTLVTVTWSKAILTALADTDMIKILDCAMFKEKCVGDIIKTNINSNIWKWYNNHILFVF